MNRVKIIGDGNGNATVLGDPPQTDFYFFALGKVLSGVYKEISWVPYQLVPIKKKNITHQSQEEVVE